jgi:hypothetical protein
MRPANIFPLLLLVLAAGTAHADMFKWTDADGNTQYGQHPPAGVQAERLKSAPAPKTAPASKSLQQRVEEMNKRTEESNRRKAEAGQQKQQAANRKINCENARQNIEKLNYGGNRLMKMPDGSYQRLDEKTKQAQLEKNRKAIKEFCD